LSDEAKFWDDCYAEGRTGWDRGQVHPALTTFIEMRLLNPCTIIVPGCGRGYEVVELAKQGFDVTAIDIATEPIEHLRKQLEPFETSSSVVQMSVFDFQPLQPVDVVYEQTCLCAIDPQLRSKYEQTVFNWLRPAGELFVLFAQTERSNLGPPFHCSLEEMGLLFPESRWRWKTKDTPKRFEHPSGKLFELAHILSKRN